MSDHAGSNDPILWVEGENPEFVRAIRQAQTTFVESFAQPLAQAESEGNWEKVTAAIVKVFFPDPTDPLRGEHLWVSFHRWTGQWIVGELTGEPKLPNLSSGQRVRVRLSNLSDWVSVIEGKATGGFTLPLILANMSETDAAAFRTRPPYCWFAPSDGIENNENV